MFCSCSRLENWASCAVKAVPSIGFSGSWCLSWAMSIFRNSSLPIIFFVLAVVVAVVAAPAADCIVLVSLMVDLLPVSLAVRQIR